MMASRMATQDFFNHNAKRRLPGDPAASSGNISHAPLTSAGAEQTGHPQTTHSSRTSPRRGPLYLNPPEAAVVLCVDEKSQVHSTHESGSVRNIEGTGSRSTVPTLRPSAAERGLGSRCRLV